MQKAKKFIGLEKLKQSLRCLGFSASLCLFFACVFCVLIGLIGFLYNIVILGIVLKEGIFVEDIVYTVLATGVPGYVLVIVSRNLFQRGRKNEN